jgi:hypothetical protein
MQKNMVQDENTATKKWLKAVGLAEYAPLDYLATNMRTQKDGSLTITLADGKQRSINESIDNFHNKTKTKGGDPKNLY